MPVVVSQTRTVPSMLPLAMMRPSPLRRTCVIVRPLAPCTRKVGCSPLLCGAGAAVGHVGIVASAVLAGGVVPADSVVLGDAPAFGEAFADEAPFAEAETDSSTLAVPAPQPASIVATTAGSTP